jgi:hypothetical protein
MRKQVIVVVGLSMAAAGCAQAPKMVWIRTDGDYIRGNPAHEQKAELDKLACLGEAQKANVSGVTITGGGLYGAIAAANREKAVVDVGKGCMADRGYLYVAEAEAPSRLAAAAEATQAAQKAQVASMVADTRKSRRQ